jgi:hypothetical protein
MSDDYETIEEVKEFMSNELYMEDSHTILALTNTYINQFIKHIDPRKYTDMTVFTKISLGGPSMLAATLIDKIAVVSHTNRDEILEKFIEGVKLAMNFVDKKNEQ